MRKIVIANLKNVQSVEASKLYFTKLVAKFDNENIDLIVCPSFVSLGVVNFLIEGTRIKLGAQNVTEEESQPVTGEITAKQLRSAGVEYVIIGHPERRLKFKESGLTINKKIKNALKNGLKCILCVGETATEKLNGKAEESIRKQIEECMKGLYENELDSVIISYEPMWAVGTEKPANVKDVETGAKIIRRAIKENYSEKASRDMLVVYGGSLNTFNSFKIIDAKEIDGAMYGANAQDADGFTSIINRIK